MIAHRLSTIKNADKIVVIDKGFFFPLLLFLKIKTNNLKNYYYIFFYYNQTGQIVEIGKHDDLLYKNGSSLLYFILL